MLRICILLAAILVKTQGCPQCYLGIKRLFQVLRSPAFAQVQEDIAITAVCRNTLFPQSKCAKLTRDVWPALLQTQFSETMAKKACDISNSTTACGSDKYCRSLLNYRIFSPNDRPNLMF